MIPRASAKVFPAINQGCRDMAETDPTTELPTHLIRNRSFWGMLTTQFLGAFNDNVFKQLVLLMAMPSVGAGADLQGWATFVFSLPFVLFSGYAGYLSDRFSKTPIIVLSKVAEIAVTSLGLVAFVFYNQWGMAGT
jgi:acyl-[acyl-carrier-protein]-phospholipid O-acyltransferase/long-chain-fatty-acid--[acyl-carrier-protein] ligase